MANPWNAAIAYLNLADKGAVRASSSVILAPPERLQNPHVARKWRSGDGGAQALTLDLGVAQIMDTVALVGLNMTLGGTVRVRASLMDDTAQTGEAYDSGILTDVVDPAYAMLVHLMPSRVTARYVRVDMSEPTVSYIEAGRLFVGVRWQFAYNFGFGWSRGYVDRSRRTESRGGQTYVDRDVSYRLVSIAFDAVTEAQRFGFVEEVDRVNGQRDDVLLITASNSTNLGRDSIWGLMSDLDPITQPAIWIDGAPAYAKAYKIQERL